MNICFYAPFKPLSHPNPSGDQVIGTGLYDFFTGKGHGVWTVSTLRCRWIFWKPWLLPKVLLEKRRSARKIRQYRPDLWFSYHTYYKSPDILGPSLSRHFRLPYVVFQGVYATKRKRNLRTRPGYLLNTRALQTASHVFTNKRKDYVNLRRILPVHRCTYVQPGIYPEDFSFCAAAQRELRASWQVGGAPVVLSAAMFRADVKTEGLALLIRACGRLFHRGKRFYLVIAGDGIQREFLTALAEKHLPGRVRFVGKIPRDRMHRFYSAGDVFAFPGIRESLGMVFLEAQSCGLPVIAFDNEGTPEVIRHRETGILAPAFAVDAFADAIGILIDRQDLRLKMSRSARAYVRRQHDLNKNYTIITDILEQIANGGYPSHHPVRTFASC